MIRRPFLGHFSNLILACLYSCFPFLAIIPSDEITRPLPLESCYLFDNIWILNFLSIKRISSIYFSISFWVTFIPSFVKAQVSTAYVKIGQIYWLNTFVLWCSAKRLLDAFLSFPYAAQRSWIILLISDVCVASWDFETLIIINSSSGRFFRAT